MYSKLIKWSLKEYHSLPWRKRRTVYRTLVSEIMLQQTTVSTVLNKFDEFILKYPSVESIARASEDELTIAWKGLGYYRRCRNLKKACEYFCEHHNSKIPNKFEELKAAPGIGDYTANAIIAIGRNSTAIAVDANLERVLSRIYLIEEVKGPKLIKLIYRKFEDQEILRGFKGSYRELNEALMDLGRVFCPSRKPKCEICPLNKKCQALLNHKQNTIPIMPEKAKEKLIEINLLRVVVTNKEKYLVYKKSEKEWLSGQVELPTFVIGDEHKTFKQYPILKKKIKTDSLISYKTNITKYKFTNFIIEMNQKEFSSLSKSSKYFYNTYDSKKENFTTASIKALKKREV